jgi:dipeptidase D
VLRTWITDEPAVLVSSSPCPAPRTACSRVFGQKLLVLLTDLPHGALEMSSAFPGNVETSSNLASVRTTGDGIRIIISVRSFVEAQLNALLGRICTLARGVEAGVETVDRYPSWEPNLGSPLLNLADKVFRRLHGKAPAIQVVHGGLECGFIVSKLPRLDALSFGPLIRFAHTPEEYVAISSVEAMWKMLVSMLKELSKVYPCEVGRSSGEFTVSAMT